MQKLTITQIGTPKQYQGSKGPYERNYIKVSELKYKDKFLNFYVNKTTSSWKVGDVVEVEAVEEKQYTAKDNTLKTSYDIKLPKFGGSVDVMKALEEIRNRQSSQHMLVMQGLKEIFEALNVRKPDLIPGTDISYPTAESEGLDPNNMANFDKKSEEDSLDDVFNSI